MCSEGLSLPLGATVGQPPTQLGKDGVSVERMLGGWGFLQRGTLSSEMNQKQCEYGGTEGEAVRGKQRGSEREKEGER